MQQPDEVSRPPTWCDPAAHHRFGSVDGPCPVCGCGSPTTAKCWFRAGTCSPDTSTTGRRAPPCCATAGCRPAASALDDDGYLTIVGRKKDIAITAGGKNLSPTNIENDLKRCRWISHAVVHGDRRPYPVVLITLDADVILPWARRHNLPTDIPAVAAEPRLHTLIQAELHRVNQNYARAAQVKKFVVLDRDLTPEAGELTRTLKVRRDVVNVRYGPLFDALYARD